ncbi:MAG: nucleotidyltransferase family protein [Candidatus Thioglobus sp.]|nr:MAG: nucleotidyltransferase family protein [Candidatus Thioglobus sp.]
MQAMILAAGRGKRMMPLTKNTPKPLLKVGGKTLIERAIINIKAAGISDIIINTAYLGEQIKQHLGNGNRLGVRIQYSIEKTSLETAGGIIKALPLLGNEPFIVVNSDVLFDLDLSTIRLPENSLAHLILVDNPTYKTNGDFSLNGKQIIPAKKPNYTFSGIGIYHPYFFKLAPQNEQKIALISLFQIAIKQHKLTGEYCQFEWQDIGTPERLELANKLVTN